jgi:hypothetical protein
MPFTLLCHKIDRVLEEKPNSLTGKRTSKEAGVDCSSPSLLGLWKFSRNSSVDKGFAAVS